MARQVLMSFEVLVYTKYAKPSQRLFTRVIVISSPSKLHREGYITKIYIMLALSIHFMWVVNLRVLRTFSGNEPSISSPLIVCGKE
jgi:hypothetical protein